MYFCHVSVLWSHGTKATDVECISINGVIITAIVVNYPQNHDAIQCVLVILLTLEINQANEAHFSVSWSL